MVLKMRSRDWIMLSICMGIVVAALAGVYLFFPQANRWVIFIVVACSLFLGYLASILLNEILVRDKTPQDRADQTHSDETKIQIQRQLEYINHELEDQANTQNCELARLNVELALQMALVQSAEQTARTNEERFRNMADNIQDGLTIIENGNLVYVNEQACEIFGACPEGDVVHRIQRFALPDEVDRLSLMIKNSAESGSFPTELLYWIQPVNGEIRYIRERYSTISTPGTQRQFVITSDMTDRIEAYQNLEQAVHDRTRELSTVLEISKKIATTLELEPLLNLILEQIGAIIPYSGAAIFTLEAETLRTAAYHVPGLPGPNYSLSLTVARSGPCLPVVLEKKVMVLNDVNGETPLALAFRESASRKNPIAFSHARSWIGIPLLIRNQVTGLLSLTHRSPGYYTQEHARLAETVTNQVAVAIENARLYEKAQTLATLEERNRIARELHDSVTQLLYGITLYCSATTRLIRTENLAQVQLNLQEIKSNALQALQEMRLLILELNPPLLQKEGLVAALQASLETIENRAGLETELKVDGIERLPRAVETELFRISMEALNNLVRYAQAKKVTVDISAKGGWVFLEISDNGVGFNLDAALNGGGMGLHSMEQRARQLGGRLEISSSPGQGTCILTEVPAHQVGVEPIEEYKEILYG